MAKRKGILLTREELNELWVEYEAKDPLQKVPWDRVVTKAQLEKVAKFIDGVFSEKKWEALLKEIDG